MGEPQVIIFVKIDQKCSKLPPVSYFTAIPGSVDSTTSLTNGRFEWADGRATGTYFS